jgi:hypothetical protein
MNAPQNANGNGNGNAREPTIYTQTAFNKKMNASRKTDQDEIKKLKKLLRRILREAKSVHLGKNPNSGRNFPNRNNAKPVNNTNNVKLNNNNNAKPNNGNNAKPNNGNNAKPNNGNNRKPNIN